MALRSARALIVAALVAACGGSASDAPADFADPDVPAAAANPDGVPYPTDSVGTVARAGRRRGERMPNLAFQAYAEGDRAAGLRTVSLADYFDPEQRRHKLLQLQIVATWCSICSAESEATVKVKEPLGREGAVFLQIIVNGNAQTEGPSLDEVHAWMDRHAANYTTAIDVRARRMGALGIDAVPWNMMIDTRSMEILHSSSGAPDDLVAYVREGLRWVRDNPPSY